MNTRRFQPEVLWASLAERAACGAAWARADRKTSRQVLTIFLLISAFVLCLLVKPGGAKTTAEADDLSEIGCMALGAYWCFAAALRKEAVDGGERRPSPLRAPLFLLGLGVSACAVGQSLWAYYEIVLHEVSPFPSWDDAAFISQYPLLFLGVLRLPTRRLAPTLRWRVVLDSLTTLTALVTFSWYFVLGPTVQQGTEPLFSKIVASMAPLGDLSLLVLLLLLLAQSRDSVSRSVAAALALGLFGVIVADTTFSYQTLRGTYLTGEMVDVGWPFGYLMIGLAASLAGRKQGARPADSRLVIPLLWRSLLPYALMPALVALVVYTHVHHGDESLEPGVYAGASLLVLLVLMRQAVAIQRLIADLKERIAELESARHELTELAERDGLTGLFNHRVFHKRLLEETARAERTRQPLTVALVDLDNFKFFNDAYGHLSGDDVLRQVARALQSCCRAEDTLARFAGDEFALLLPGVAVEDAGRFARQIQTTLNEHGYRPQGQDVEIPLRLSVGSATFPQEGARRLEILALADARLYRAKTGGGDDSAQRLRMTLTHSIEGFSMLDALVAAVDNKDRYTGKHSEDVMAFSLEIAWALGLDERTQQTIATAALLHDVGKVGVPDAILRKPGHLTEEEYAAVRHHPTMGAILVGAVPGFDEVLDAVRHHHERWDGDGYPFGLRGEETPLIARLMAVADSYSAMTTDRPYRKGMPPDAALVEITRGAGSQFDPALAHLFVAARRAALTDPAADASPTLQRVA